MINDPARKEQLRAQLVDLLRQYETGQVQSHVLLEHLLVALIGALEDPPAAGPGKE